MKKMPMCKKVMKFDSTSFQVVKKFIKIFYFFLNFGTPFWKKKNSKKLKISIFVPFLAYYFIWPQKILSRVFFQGGVLMTPSCRNCTILEPVERRVNIHHLLYYQLSIYLNCMFLWVLICFWYLKILCWNYSEKWLKMTSKSEKWKWTIIKLK